MQEHLGKRVERCSGHGVSGEKADRGDSAAECNGYGRSGKGGHGPGSSTLVRPGRWLARALGHGLIREDLVEDADAIVILGGDADAIVILGGDARHRVPCGLRLHQEGRAPRILAVGGRRHHGHWTEARRTLVALEALGLPAGVAILVERDAPGTAEEARAVASFAADQGWGRVLVVTSPYHTRRAGHLFDRQGARYGIDFRLVPAWDDPYDAHGWWRDPRQRMQVRNEVLKHLVWKMGLRRR